MKNFQLTYLYIDTDGIPSQSDTPPTDVDIFLLESNLLQVYRWYIDAYEHLIVEDGKLTWSKVVESEICEDAEEELGKYHA